MPRGRVAAIAIAVAVLAGTVGWVLGSRSGDGSEPPPSARSDAQVGGDATSTSTTTTTADAVPVSPELPAMAAARRFLDTYVADDGRVVRHDQGGDTVSEGQAYAVLLAAAIGDDATLDSVWGWTAAHLQRPDGLLSWHWADGAVVDRGSAPDAEIDAIRGLLLASDHSGDDRAVAARGMADAVAAQLVVPSPQGTGMVLAPGEWAIERHVANPSYFSPRTIELLADASVGPWSDLLDGSRAEILGLTDGGRLLPPDWSTWDASTPVPAGGPGLDGTPVYSWDAARVPIRLAESCDLGDRALAASWAPLLLDDPSRIVRHLDGQVTAEAEHPVALVAAAASAHAAGDPDARDELLDRAQQLDEQRPSYYGSAWVALGRVLLQTDLAGPC